EQVDSPAVGVVVDTYHVWWDPNLAGAIQRAAAADRLLCYQVCDWNLPLAAEPLFSRGYMGDGFIDFPAITKMVAASGYSGDIEVENFNEDVWATPAHAAIGIVKERYQQLVLPHAGGARAPGTTAGPRFPACGHVRWRAAAGSPAHTAGRRRVRVASEGQLRGRPRGRRGGRRGDEDAGELSAAGRVGSRGRSRRPPRRRPRSLLTGHAAPGALPRLRRRPVRDGPARRALRADARGAARAGPGCRR